MKTVAKAAAVLGMVVVASGCTTTGISTDAESVAFGSFTLISNGHQAELGSRPLERDAVIHVRSLENRHSYTGRVSHDGRFSLAVPAGNYVLETIAFEHHDEMIEAPANFRFSVPDQYKGVYIGDLTLEATLDSGIYGVVGTADRYTINNGCLTDCADDLDALGLSESNAGVSLMSWDHQMAANTR